MLLNELLNGIEVIDKKIELHIEIKGIASDSRKVKEGYIFVAIKGENTDGNLYIDEAIENGAIVIIGDKALENDRYIRVDNARSALSKLWSNYYEKPDKDITIIAITGTNGKTSTAYCLYKILRENKINCGLISTIDCLINDEVIETKGGSEVSDKAGAMTTPDPEILYYLLNKMKEKQVKCLIMEASSHALKQSKLDFLNIEIGIFTNLSREHLDYHKNIEDYFEAKKKLFKICNVGITNIDDAYGKKLYQIYRGRMLSISIEGEADFTAKKVKCLSKGTEFTLQSQSEQIRFKTNLYGEINVYNLLMAIACANAMGIKVKSMVECVKSIKIKGRLEKYKDKNVFIDYAHTPVATENVLKTIKQIYKKRNIITVFGCGGNRDIGKRQEIGRICSKYSKHMVITSDNSRNERTEKIIKDILEGVDNKSSYTVIENRRQAIEYAVKNAKRTDIILLLGKGHENYEITNTGKIYFDEREVLSEVFKK